MKDWDAIKELGTYIWPGTDRQIFDKISSSPGQNQYLKLFTSSVAEAFQKKYDDKTVALLSDIIFGTDFSLLGSEGEPIEILSRDVFRRLSWAYRRCSGTAYEKAFDEFDEAFCHFIRSFRATFRGIVFSLGLKKEPISLENVDAKYYLYELRELPCRKLGYSRFSDLPPGDKALYGHIEGLLKKYEATVLEEDNCRKILEIVGKLSGYPGYFKTLSAQHKLLETRPMLLAISDLQLYPGNEVSKNDLLSALAIVLFNVYSTPNLLKFIVKFKPSPENELLSYEYYAILAMNYLLWGKLGEAASFNEKALSFATDDEKRANTQILGGCIHISRKDYNAALNSLYNCASLTKNSRARASAYFYMGLVNYEVGNAAEALDCFKMSVAGIEDDLDMMIVYNNMGACAMLLGDVKDAAKAFGKVIHAGRNLNGNTAKACRSIAYGSLGIIRFSEADYGQALASFKEALRLHKELHDKKRSADQLGNIGLAMKLTGEHRQALDHFKSSLSVSFSDDYLDGVLYSFDQIEQLTALEGRFEDAENFRQEVIRRNPGIAKMLKK